MLCFPILVSRRGSKDRDQGISITSGGSGAAVSVQGRSGPAAAVLVADITTRACRVNVIDAVLRFWFEDMGKVRGAGTGGDCDGHLRHAGCARVRFGAVDAAPWPGGPRRAIAGCWL